MDEQISKNKAIEAIAAMMPKSFTPDGSHPADEEIFRIQEIYADCIEAIEILPTQPGIVRCKDCKFYTSMRPDIKTGICDLNVHHMGDDGFCSCGERKKEKSDAKEKA